MRRLPLAALLVVLLAGCGSDEQPAATKPPPPAVADQGRLTARPAESSAQGSAAGTQKLGGALLYVPPGDGPKRSSWPARRRQLPGGADRRCCARTPTAPV